MNWDCVMTFIRVTGISIIALLILVSAVTYNVCGLYEPPTCGTTPEYLGGCCDYAPCLCVRNVLRKTVLPYVLVNTATVVTFLTIKKVRKG